MNKEKCLEERIEYLSKFKKRFSFEELKRDINNIKNIKVLCIGDTVIDRYTFVAPKGRAIKDPIISTTFRGEEDYAGGVLALANHISDYINEISLITLIGSENSNLSFIKNSLPKNVMLKTFTKDHSTTTIKQRYIDYYKGDKLFKVEYLDDSPISKKLSKEISDYLLDVIPNYDLVEVLDFGHGFINLEIRRILQEKAKFISINSQTNSANFGFNYITNYSRADFMSMNDLEIRLPMRMKFENIGEVIDSFSKQYHYNKFLVTLGKKGGIFFNKGKKYFSPLLTDKLVDSIGAGDAIFAIISLLIYSGVGDERIPFIANCIGGVDVNIIGNKEYVKKKKLLNFISDIYNGMG